MNEQRTEGWHVERLGKITASRLGDLMATTKSGPSASRRNLIVQLALERHLGKRKENKVSAAMQHGTETEPLALAAYEAATGTFVDEAHFVPHPTIPNTGASPDGLVGSAGLVEAKCPDEPKHLATLKGAAIDRGYMLQMQWQMACTGRQWCDFVSFDNRFPENAQLYIVRVLRDDKVISEIAAAVIDAEHEIEAEVAFLRDYRRAA